MKNTLRSDALMIIYVSIILILLPGVYTGFACLNNPCVHGVCIDDLNSTYLCYCIDGYTGVHCQTNWNECWSNPCLNGAICIDGIAMFNCSCAPGFTGELCEIDLNECESNPCLNNGTCLDAVNGYVCNCLAGYSGEYCEIDIAVCNSTNVSRCANGGICEEGPGESFNCKCLPGWEGSFCTTETNECLANPCQNGAVCIDLLADYNCACAFGFMGKNCEEEIRICDSNNCQNNALCLIEEGFPVCYCVPDFHGDLCQYQYDECQLGVRCINGGTCIDGVDNFTCSCLPNLTGVFCECLILPDGSQNCSFINSTTIYQTSTDNFTTIQFTETTPFDETMITHETGSDTTLQGTRFPTDTYYFSSSTPLEKSTNPTSQFFNITKSITFTISNEFTTYEDNINYYSTEKTDMFSTSTESSTRYSETTENTDIDIKLYNFTQNFENTTELTKSDSYSDHPSITAENTLPYSLGTTTSLEISTTEFSPTTFKKPTEIASDSFFTTTSSTSLSLVTDYTKNMTENVTSLIITTGSYNTQSQTFSTSYVPTFIPTTADITTFNEGGTTIYGIRDCTQEGNECRNGGTCISEDTINRCACPFDTEGEFCEIHLGVRNAAFNGQSYLAHRLIDLSHINFEFEVTTVTSRGLIFHLVTDKIFMSLYIKDNILEFKFSCGYQTMLLKELRTLVNNGYAMHISVKLHFLPNFSHCDASVKVNDTLSMRGDQITSMPQLTKPTVWLYFGGVPNELKNTDSNFEGFSGCMKNLKISGKPVNIFGGAEDGSAIAECSSLACLSNPCNNGGTCIVKAEKWSCHCRNGYLGKQCELSVCGNNPCLFGGTCVSLSKSGYICLCPYGKHGHFCENDIKITHPYFPAMAKGWSSYVAYSIPKELSNNLEIKFKFLPTDMDQISMLLFIGQTGHHDMFSDHVAVSLIKGYVMLTWNLGSGPRRIFTNQPLQKGLNDYTVHLGLRGRRAWLYVENIGNITGRSPGSFENLDVDSVLFIGGHESRYFNKLPHDLPQHSGFMGCIFDIRLKAGSDMIPVKPTGRTIGRSVNQCGVSECYKNRCPNMAACLHHGSTFTCLCQDSWYGPLCLTKVNPCDSSSSKCSSGSTCVPLIEGYECDCPYGKTGRYCEKDQNISDVSFQGTRSFLSIKSHELNYNKFNIKLQMKPLSDKGMLLFIGKTDNFISLYLQSGVLELRIKRGKQRTSHNLVTVRSSRLLVQGVWHNVKLGMFGRNAYLSVENVLDTALMDKDSYASNTREKIYIGGLPDMSKLPLDALLNNPTSFIGCVRLIEVDSNFIPLNLQNIEAGRNIVDCDGTPCGGDVCRNGGTCWLDSFRQSHCNCLPPFFGTHCDNVYSCSNNTCTNKGKCNDNKCYCIPGRDGFYCENEIIVKVPEFKRGSYLIIDKKHNKRRGALSKYTEQISINFTTASLDGLLLWHKEVSHESL
ncbi:hypothetical protein WA026_006852 [Henosepilachna vigintioctopunctata]|uniref:Protein eyes shut n=1 Tax=Henosepilachna vigintioctopunctata TaxID=420089 RepID=A0AAW1UB98_9CUCU